MDRISDSGSDGCGSIPHGGTKSGLYSLAVLPTSWVPSLFGSQCRPAIEP